MKLTIEETEKLFDIILESDSDAHINIEIVDGRLYAAMDNEELVFVAGPPILPESKV